MQLDIVRVVALTKKLTALRPAALLPLLIAGGLADPAGPPSPYTVRLVTVAPDVRLEVLDWGGTGRPLILLAGLGGTAHEFEGFAPHLTDVCHVYAITRRGFGASSSPTSGYSADELGDDVLKVVDALKVRRPILAAHSMGGEELSSIGSRHPESVAGLIYLEAAYAYAFYNPNHPDLSIDALDFRAKLMQVVPANGQGDPRTAIQKLLEAMPQLERELREQQKWLASVPIPPPGQDGPPAPLPIREMFAGTRKYTSVRVPVLALFASPHDLGDFFKSNPIGLANAEAEDKAMVNAQVDAVLRAAPSARVVRIPRATHWILGSNREEVLRETKAFLGALP